MKIKKILSQHRRDFKAIYECEHCEHTHEDTGYDDTHFHKHVIPAMKCKECGKKAPADFQPRSPKHPANKLL